MGSWFGRSVAVRVGRMVTGEMRYAILLEQDFGTRTADWVCWRPDGFLMFTPARSEPRPEFTYSPSELRPAMDEIRRTNPGAFVAAYEVGHIDAVALRKRHWDRVAPLRKR